MTYTLIPIMYRDPNNYKDHGIVICDGSPDPAILAEIADALHDDEYSTGQFVPHQIGLDPVGGSAPEDWDDEDDAPSLWHEMRLHEVSTSESADLTSAAHTQRAGTLAEFRDRVAAASIAGWNPAPLP